MMMMLIGIDDARIKKDGYDPKSLWKWIEEVFEARKWTKEPQADNTVLFVGSVKNDNLLADVYYIYSAFADDKNFGKYCIKWIGYENEDDESLPFIEDDILYRERKENPLFRIGA